MEEDSVLLCDMIRPSSGEERGGKGGREQDEGGVVEQTVGGGGVVDTCGSSGPRFLWGKVCTEEVSTQRGETYVVPATDTQENSSIAIRNI